VPPKEAGGAARVHDIPQDVSALCPLQYDYADLFMAPTYGADAAPEQWARAAMEGAPAAGRFVAWQVLSQLRLATTATPDRIAGWAISGRGDDWVRVEAAGRYMTANVVFRVREGRVLFGTFVRYDRAAGRLLWTPVSVVHRAAAPGFLAAGVSRVRRRGGEEYRSDETT
jgi:hypothetical protein